MKRLGASIAMLALICLAAALVVFVLTTNSRARIADADTRLQAFRAEELDLWRQLPASGFDGKAVNLPKGMAWPETDLAKVELAMQQAIIATADSAGLQLISFGAMGLVEKGPLPSPSYDLELDGGHAEIATFLSELEKVTPGFAVTSLWMRQLPPDGLRPVAPVSLRVSLWVVAPALSQSVAE